MLITVALLLFKLEDKEKLDEEVIVSVDCPKAWFPLGDTFLEIEI